MLCTDWAGLPATILEQLRTKDLSIPWAMRGTCKSWRRLASAPARGQPPSSFTLGLCISIGGLMRFLMDVCSKASSEHLTSISLSHVESGGVCCELYAGLASCCPKLQELSLNLEGPSTGWLGVEQLPRCLTFLKLRTHVSPPSPPLTVFNVLSQLRHLHLTVVYVGALGVTVIKGDLKLPHLQTLRIDGPKIGTVHLPGFTGRGVPTICSVHTTLLQPPVLQRFMPESRARHTAKAMAVLNRNVLTGHHRSKSTLFWVKCRPTGSPSTLCRVPSFVQRVVS